MCGIVKTGGAFDAAAIADEYWRLHREQPYDAPEVVFGGDENSSSFFPANARL